MVPASPSQKKNKRREGACLIPRSRPTGRNCSGGSSTKGGRKGRWACKQDTNNDRPFAQWRSGRSKGPTRDGSCVGGQTRNAQWKTPGGRGKGGLQQDAEHEKAPGPPGEEEKRAVHDCRGNKQPSPCEKEPLLNWGKKRKRIPELRASETGQSKVWSYIHAGPAVWGPEPDEWGGFTCIRPRQRPKKEDPPRKGKI